MGDFLDLIARLVEKQDDLEPQREALWPRYVAFREGLYEALIQFCTEAKKRGLLGVRLPMIELEPDEDDLEIVVTLNGQDPRRVASGEFLLDPTRAEWPEPQPNESGWEAFREPCLSFRSYVYPHAGDESIPYCPQPCGELVAS